MALRIVAGTANPTLADTIADALDRPLSACDIERFPDGELRPVVEMMQGDDVYIVQPTSPPVNEHLVELLLLVDACRRAGAARVTAVVPYFGYARQDRRGRAGEAIGARVALEAIANAGADRLVVVDPHTTALEAMTSIRVEQLTAVPHLAAALRPRLAPDTVLVAPDLGAVKLAERYAGFLGCAVVVVRKTRVSGTAVRAESIIGDVDGRRTIIVDDMISTGATIEAAVRVLEAHGAQSEPIVVASHGLFVGSADRLRPLERFGAMIVSDSIPQCFDRNVTVCSIAPLLADAIGRLHNQQPLDELLLVT